MHPLQRRDFIRLGNLAVTGPWPRRRGSPVRLEGKTLASKPASFMGAGQERAEPGSGVAVLLRDGLLGFTLAAARGNGLAGVHGSVDGGRGGHVADRFPFQGVCGRVPA